MRYRLDAPGGNAVAVENGRIVVADGEFDLVVNIDDGEIRPGLINAHDHLQLNHYPRLGEPPYRNSYEWGNDLHARFSGEIARAKTLDRRSALLFGALKNLLGAVTTVVHHDVWYAGLDDAGFPVRVPRVHNAHSLGFEPDVDAAFAAAATAQRPICIHVAEGLDEIAGAEVQMLATRGLLDERVLAVHAIAVDCNDVNALREAGAAVVWCPTSNRFLFDRDAPNALIGSGIDVLLGTDSLLTAAGTMFDELRAARALGFIADAQLLDGVGETAARRFGFERPSLDAGSAADIVVLNRPVLEALPSDVSLAIIAGKPRLGDAQYAELFDYCGVRTECLIVGGKPKLVAAPLADIAGRVCELTPECARILN